MAVLTRVAKLISEPQVAMLQVRSRLDRKGLRRRQAELARAAGIDRLYLILSFDCDTEEDFKAAERVHDRLGTMGVTPVYAVPGELLERGEKVYRRFFETGSEFINHGYVEHTYFDERTQRHASSFFYDTLPTERAEQDVIEGHLCLRRVFGIESKGYRTPHFGTFQNSTQLQMLHRVLSGLGCTFSTSTVPAWGFSRGPVFEHFGLREIPVTGMGSRPLTILDTWGCFEAPNRTHSPLDYEREGALLADEMAAAGPGVLNLYGDPSHIDGEDAFFRTVGRWLEVAAPINYAQLLNITGGTPLPTRPEGISRSIL